MSDHAALVARYIDSWNESDAARRQALVAGTFAPDATYVDPLMRESGHEGLDRLMRAVQERFPGFRFALTRPVESLDDHVRFSWALGPDAGAPVVEGTDFARVAADGRFAMVRGFLDRVPDAR